MPHAPADILGPAGPIAAQLARAATTAAATGGGYEPRPEQQRMAEAVATAFDSRSRLLVEAGTGVGKSFAYLVPAILRCLLRGEKVVIATATISLQEQLIHKDIPLLAASLASWNLARPDDLPIPALTPVLAKGRGNYLSIRRLKLASQRQDRILADPEQRHSLHIIEDWAYQTTEGTLSTLPALPRPDVWEYARSDGDNCMGRKCPTYKECFYQNARRELEKANLIICNHALFFSDLALRARGSASNGGGSGGSGGAILPAYDHIVLDEAHNIEDAACEHFGLSLTAPRVSRLLRTLYQPRKRPPRGYLLERSLTLGDPESVDRAIRLVDICEQHAREFFDDLLAHFERNPESGGRVRRSGIVENNLTPSMRDLALRLRSIRDSIESEPDRFELNSYARRASDIADIAEVLVDQSAEGQVYWIEVEGRGDRDGAHSRFGPRVTLSCAPIEVGPILRRFLFHAETDHVAPSPPSDAGDAFDQAARGEMPGEQRDPAAPPRVLRRQPGIVLTSATLATRSIREGEHPEHAEAAFSHVLTALGIDDATTLQLGSPFDYARQARVIIDLTMPSPRADGPGAAGGSGGGAKFADLLAERVDHHVRATRGGAFVLFTSFATLYAVADRLRRGLEDDGMPVFVHGRDGSRQHILARFMENEHGVLFGAASFWQGVDVRGERLRNVIITRLPFEPPDRPLTQARLERIETSGGNPFMQESLPRAVIRFKQGFGRLVRSRTDVGRVVVLDPRIRTARYGKMFLDALPEGVRIEERRPDDEF